MNSAIKVIAKTNMFILMFQPLFLGAIHNHAILFILNCIFLSLLVVCMILKKEERHYIYYFAMTYYFGMLIFLSNSTLSSKVLLNASQTLSSIIYICLGTLCFLPRCFSKKTFIEQFAGRYFIKMPKSILLLNMIWLIFFYSSAILSLFSVSGKAVSIKIALLLNCIVLTSIIKRYINAERFD